MFFVVLTFLKRVYNLNRKAYLSHVPQGMCPLWPLTYWQTPSGFHADHRGMLGFFIRSRSEARSAELSKKCHHVNLTARRKQMKCTCSMQSPLTSAKMTKSINLCSYALQPKPGFMRHQSYFLGHLSN